MDGNNPKNFRHMAVAGLIYAAAIVVSVMGAFGFSPLPSDVASSQPDNSPGDQPVIAGLSAANPVIFPMGGTGRW